MGSSTDHSEKHAVRTRFQQVDVATADVAAELTAGSEGMLDPQEALRLR